MSVINQRCAFCNKEITSLYRSSRYCQEKCREKAAREQIKRFFSTLGSLAERLLKENRAGTQAEYKEIRKTWNEINKLAKEGDWKCPLIKADLETLNKSCRDLTEEYISPKDRTIVNNKLDKKYQLLKVCCKKENIQLDEKDQEYYCDYCWERDTPRFLNNLRALHFDKLFKLVSESNLNSSEAGNKLNIFLNTNFTSQDELKQGYQAVEWELRELVRNKGDNQVNNDKNVNMNAAKKEGEKTNNYGLWIGLGTGTLVLVTGLVYWFRRKK